MSEKKNALEKKKEQYEELNRIASPAGVVFFGNEVFCEMDFSELAGSFGLSEPIYNRSLAHVLPEEIPAYLDACIVGLHPKKVFLEVGSEEENGRDPGETMERLEWLLYTVHQKTGAKIWLVCTAGREGRGETAERFRALAAEYGCGFVDISAALRHPRAELKIFEQLKPFIRLNGIGFFEAMNPVVG